MSYKEILELLPFLGKGDKKKLYRQLKAGTDKVPDGYPKISTASGSGDNPNASRQATAFGVTLEPQVPKPKAALKAELEQWLRKLYIEQLDRHGNLKPSSCAPLPRGRQLTCSHPFNDLKWGANGAAQYARCGLCNLPHVVYFDTNVKQALMVGQAESYQAAADAATAAAALAAADAAVAAAAAARERAAATPLSDAPPPPPPPDTLPPETLEVPCMPAAAPENEAKREPAETASPITPPTARLKIKHAPCFCQDPDSSDPGSRIPREYVWDQVLVANLPGSQEKYPVVITARGGSLQEHWHEDWKDAALAVQQAVREGKTGQGDVHAIDINTNVDFRTVLRAGNPYHSKTIQTARSGKFDTGKPPPTNFNHQAVGDVARNLELCEIFEVPFSDWTPWRVCDTCQPLAKQQLRNAQKPKR